MKAIPVELPSFGELSFIHAVMGKNSEVQFRSNGESFWNHWGVVTSAADFELGRNEMVVWVSPITAIQQGVDPSFFNLPDEYKALLGLLQS